jgi:hypothetical protein
MFAVVCDAAAGPGYLSVVGPPPLRFAAPPAAPSDKLIPLPPLTVIEPRPAATNESSTHATSPATTNTGGAVEHPVLDPFAVPTTEPAPVDSSGAPLAAPAQADSIVPQMFMKYFSGRAGTNGPGVSIYSPVGFIPPQPVAPPASSSSFQTTPPAKP